MTRKKTHFHAFPIVFVWVGTGTGKSGKKRLRHIANASQQRYLRVMFVCICNAILEDELREIARHGVTDPEAAYAVLGKSPQCGTCLDHADDVMASERSRCAGTCPSRARNLPSSGAFAAA